MKKLLVCFLAVMCAATAFAQKPTTGQMDKTGQSGPSEESRYVLGLVRNGDAQRLNAYFDAAPWKIQTEIDAYTNADRTASVAVFCAAVDLGNIDVVKAFVDHGYGPADLCRVQQFGTKRIIVSKADLLISGGASSSSNSSSSNASSSSSSHRGWFSKSSSSSLSSSFGGVAIEGKYRQITDGEKKVTKTYFANPLDFADGEMFDYLWSKGFRSNNLFTKQALAEAKRLERMDVWQYIMDNKPEVLADKPSYISQETYKELLTAAAQNPYSLAYESLERNVLGKKINTSAQARQKREELKRMLQRKLDTRPVLKEYPADTLGYARMDETLAAKEAQLKRAENVAFAAKQAKAAHERLLASWESAGKDLKDIDQERLKKYRSSLVEAFDGEQLPEEQKKQIISTVLNKNRAFSLTYVNCSRPILEDKSIEWEGGTLVVSVKFDEQVRSRGKYVPPDRFYLFTISYYLYQNGTLTKKGGYEKGKIDPFFYTCYDDKGKEIDPIYMPGYR